MEEKFAALREKYFPAPVKKLVPGKQRNFPLYIYLELNQRLVLRFKPEHELTDQEVQTHLDRGLENFWCPNEFLYEWQNYLLDEASTSDPKDEENGTSDESAEKNEPPGEEAALAIEVLNSKSLNEDQKRTLLSEIGTEMLGLLAAAESDDPQEIEDAMQKCNKFTDDIIRVAAQSHEMSSIYDDIRLVSEGDIEHSTAVATFAVIFAMGAGFSERELLADIAFASFLHDVGVVSLDPEIFGTPMRDLNPGQQAEYRNHVQEGLKFLDDHQVPITASVREIISQHHERFDGKGFPAGIPGLQLNEMSQIVSMADYLHDLISGREDGERKNPADALEHFQKVQEAEGGAQLFNPELFASILQMIHDAKGSKEKATRFVESVGSGI